MRLGSVQLKTDGNKVRHWIESTHQVVQGHKVVGVVKISKTAARRADVLAEFASSAQTIKNLKALRLPAEFSYIWIEVLEIQELSRRQGYGTQIFDLIKATRHNALLALNPHEIAANYPIKTILSFYRKQGFVLSRFDYEWYGFLYLP
jgi:hypothetical protein